MRIINPINLVNPNKRFYELNKSTIDNLYSRACDRHGGDLYLLISMDRRRGNLRKLEQEINKCGCCIPK